MSAHRDTVVVTPTASGKTLCYNLPVLDAILKDPDARALYLFPTKALSRDQSAELLELMAGDGAPSSGRRSTTATRRPAERRVVRDRAHVILTQPGHAPHGDPPAPRAVDEAVREPEASW